jgi:DNA-binding MarR family transcriptional regulator
LFAVFAAICRPIRDRRVGMTMQARIPALPGLSAATGYLEVLSLIERLHRLLLDVIKDEFERLRIEEINPVQALLIFNIGENEVSAGELKTRGFYQGSNVSYNLKKLVQLGYLHHQRSEIDRRSVRVRLTDKGQRIRTLLGELFARHAETLAARAIATPAMLEDAKTVMRRLERFWTDQIRYIY